MIAVPVFERELLVAARQPFTFTLRTLGAGLVLAVCALVVMRSGAGPQLGSHLFACLHQVVWLSIWFLVPLLSADCISRERREGTLPLLFLTSLAPIDLVLAKATVHGLRAFTLWLAAVPVISVAFVAGGVSWQEALLSVFVNCSSLCLALSAGIVASTRAQSWVRAAIAASCLGWLFCLIFILGVGGFLVGFMALRGGPPVGWSASDAFNWAFQFGFAVASGVDISGGQLAWKALLSLSPQSPRLLIWGAAIVLMLSIIVALLLIRLAAWSVSRVWREEPPSRFVRQLQGVFCQPILLKAALQRWLRWELERNPVGWLQQRTWSARLVSWSWVGILLFVYTALVSDHGLPGGGGSGVDEFQVRLALLLAASLAAAAAGSFRRERETGVLELLLVAPLKEWQIISGRVRGLWGQFFPAILLLFCVWLFFSTFTSGEGRPGWMLFCILLFLTVPGIGLYYSLSMAGFFSALFWTIVVGLILPGVFAHVGYALVGPGGWGGPTYRGWLEAAVLIQAAVGVILLQRLYHKLKGREFRYLGAA